MIIEYEGQRYPFEFDDITVKQAIKIEKHTGLTLSQWGKELAENTNLTAMQALGWLVLHGGRDIPVEDCDFKLVKLGEAFMRAAGEEAARQKAADEAEDAAAGPTPPPSPPSENGAGATGDLSLPLSPMA